MKIYTRTGDSGETGLFGGGRVRKNHARVQAYGSVDELSSVLGWALLQVGDHVTRSRILLLQHDLFAVGSHLATPGAENRGTADTESRPALRLPSLPTQRAEEMERWIDEAEEALTPLGAFVLPGGSPGASALHVARSVCRRAERAVSTLASDEDVHPVISAYLNRLSDLLFTWARLENHRSGVEDTVWRKDAGR